MVDQPASQELAENFGSTIDVCALAWRLVDSDGAIVVPYLACSPDGLVSGEPYPALSRWEIIDHRLIFRARDGTVTLGFPWQSASSGKDREFLHSDRVMRLENNAAVIQLAEPNPLPILHYMSPRRRRNLLIVRAGVDSVHPKWDKDLSESNRTWDICLSLYGDAAFEEADIIVEQRHERKFEALYNLLHLGSQLWDYDYIGFIDDDIYLKLSDINEMFETCCRFKLGIGHPSQSSRGYVSYAEMHQQADHLLRFVTMTDLLMLVFSRAALRRCAPVFALDPDGFGVDFAISRVLPMEANNIAIIDKVAIVHTRPPGTSYDEQTARVKAVEVSSRFGLTDFYTIKETGSIYSRSKRR